MGSGRALARWPGAVVQSVVMESSESPVVTPTKGPGLRLRDPVSGLTHLVFAVVAVIGATVLITLAAVSHKWWHLAAFIVYGVSLCLLYLASSLYHLLPVSEPSRSTLRQLDHIAILLLIAGTYTPVCLVPLRGPLGWSLFGAVWGLALVGMFVTIFAIKGPRWLGVALYLALGWLVIVAVWPLFQRLSPEGLAWLGLGGVFYSVGAVIYAEKKPNPIPGVFGFHEIFHIFVMLGSLSHFVAIVRAVLPLP
jgi:hemolysin III